MKFLWFYLLLYGSLGLGLLFRSQHRKAPLLMRFTILLIDAPLFFYSFWLLDLAQVRRFAPIPILATLLVLLPLWLSPLWAKRLLENKSSQGSFILAAAFSNIGTTGGAFICYLLFGLKGLALAYLFLLPYPIIIFTLGFSVAKQYACDCQLRPKDYFLNIMTNLFSLVPLLAIALGITINALGFTPSSQLAHVADVLIKLGLGIMCLAIGMTVNPRHIFTPLKPILAMGALKFLILPSIATILILLTYGSFQPLAAKIIFIQSAMPPAIYAVITANLYGLDRNLVNALWFSVTLFLIPIATLLFLFMG
jgi:predicted permease